MGCYTRCVSQRRLVLGAIVEWAAAIACVLGLIWVISVPVQRLTGPRVEAALVDVADRLPPGVPAGAAMVPVLLLLDGRSIRVGDLESKVKAVLPERLADGPPLLSTGDFGERRLRAYLVNGTRVHVLFDRAERGEPLKVSGLYVR